MDFLSNGALVLGRLLLAAAFVLVLFLPAWWLADRLQDTKAHPFFRALFAIGLALIGYLSFVNLLGRLIELSITPVLIYLVLNAACAVFIWRRWPRQLSLMPLVRTWRSWAGPVLLAIVLGVPQWMAAVSSPFWDEVASSAIHITAVNQFAENLYPPRHNALPNVAIKYHYAVTILSGTVRWLGGLSANVSIDVVSTALWLFAFLFSSFWLRELNFNRVSATWGGFAVLLGGGLDWLYLRRTEVYDGIWKTPEPSTLVSRYDGAKSWIENLIAVGKVPDAHLRNADGSLSNLPWDIAAQFQQHAVALGIALTLVTLYLFVIWQKRKTVHVPLLVANVIAFSVLFLAHAVFGGVAAVTASLYLLGAWLRERTRVRFYRGLAFAAGSGPLALLHGGLLSTGAQYGASSDVMTLRGRFGYGAGGIDGFIHWNLAGFGLPLLLAVGAAVAHLWKHDRRAVERNLAFSVLAVFTTFSYFVPHLTFYSSDAVGVEEFTEISKFFFTAHFGLALLSVFAISWIVRRVHWSVVTPGFVAMAITPLAFCYATAFKPDHSWLGFYRAPYGVMSIEQQMAEALGRLKKSNHDVYFDASADERRHGYLGEMFEYAGSIFTLTPSRYEQTGIGYRLSEQVVAQRFTQNGRMARLAPGAAEDCQCRWYYVRPVNDMASAPLIVRSRFAKLIAEGDFVVRFQAGLRALYSIEKPTRDIDRGIEKYWRPRIVSQTRTDTDGDGKSDLIFYDYVDGKILAGASTIDLPAWLKGEFVQLYTASFPGEKKVDFLFGRLKDTEFRRGKKLSDLVERSSWGWTYRDSATAVWQPEYEQWLWDWDVPVITDLDHGGFDSHVSYRPRSREWVLAPGLTISGPVMPEQELPVPFGGRFLEGLKGDLGLWSLRTWTLSLQSVQGAQRASFAWGGDLGDVLVPGDYNGDGYDGDIAVWRRGTRTWYWRRAPDGPISQATFGTDTSVPLPWDYNHDGRLDLAYWEPGEGKIYVSLTGGRSVDLVVRVPPHSLPAFVNMY